MPSTTTPMGRPLSDEPLGSKSSKRKITRSVSTLTPSQLARKRANDREAQRAIRARTKEHIERLERELEKLRSEQNCDRTLQGLLRRNKVLEEGLSHLRGSMGMSMAGSPYSADDYVSGYIPTSVPTSMMPTSNSLESLDDFCKNNMQMQGAPPSVYIQHAQAFNAGLPHS